MKKFINPLILATALAATACTNTTEDPSETVDPSGKTAISFVGESSSAPTTRAGFKEKTQIAMHIRSTKDASNIKETRTLANALKDATQKDDSYSSIEAPNNANIRYWDDAYGRDAKLSVFAVAVPSMADVKNGAEDKSLVDHLSGDESWADGKLTETIDWTVSTDQLGDGTEDILAKQDLTYSSNIQNGGLDGAKSYNYTSSDYSTVNNGELIFRLKDPNVTDGPGKFDQGHLVFTHALSRITINLIKGTSFGENSFNFATDTNVKLLSVPTSGTLDIEKGTWSSTTSTDISKMKSIETAKGAAYSLRAQMLPGFVIDGKDTNVMEFTIENSKYFVTKAMMLKALNGDKGTATSFTMEQGKNYVFNLTVDKKAVDVTATLEPWGTVDATNQNMNNSHITVTLTENGAATAVDKYDWYRLNDGTDEISTVASSAKNWDGNYITDNKAILTQDGSVWKTNWYFDNNKSFYHFRAVNKNTEIKANDTDDADYFEITAGDQANHDYQWGAPMVNTTANPLTYSDNGYASVISPAIGATNDAIKLTMLHMMSNIKVILKTTKTNNNVKLEDNTKQCEVSLIYFYEKGKVYMGNGKVIATDDALKASSDFTKPSAGIDETDATYNTTGTFTFAAVPQSLVRTTGTELYVGISIKTPDGNQYIIKNLSTINVASSSTAISSWTPGREYTYTFILTKTGITNVTCSVVDWKKVTATDTGVSLEN